MKKMIVIATVATAMLAASGFAEANGNGRNHRGVHHQPRHHYAPARHVNRHFRQQRYARQGRQHARYERRHGYRNHYRRHDHRRGLRIAAGAIVLGSLIHAINHDRHERVVYRTRQTATRDYGNYLLDSDGQCYDVSTNNQGQEVWTWVDPSYCR